MAAIQSGVRVGDDEIVFAGGIDDEEKTTYVSVTRGGKKVLELSGRDIDLDRFQGEVGLFVPDVYRAFDTIHRERVALKMPRANAYAGDEEFLHEVQVATKLQHPNILSVINASYIDDQFVIAMELGDESLADRIERRISTARAMDLAGQGLAALAHAHEHRIIHCDIKPENFILFPGNQLKLADFGFAKISLRTLKASGSGTIDYIAPEQAMGRPKFQSDVFSSGLVLYRMFAGKLPRWPYEWPPEGHRRLQKKLHPDMVALIRRAIEIRPRKRYPDGLRMYGAFQRLRRRALR